MNTLVRIALCTGLLACTAEESVPADLLPRETFKDILLEAQLIEALANQELAVDKRLNVPVELYYTDLFAQHGTTKDVYRNTFQWYAEHPAELKEVYLEIITELEQRGK